MVTISGEQLSRRETGRGPAVSKNVSEPKLDMSGGAADTWVYILVAGLFAVIAITVGISYSGWLIDSSAPNG